MTIIERIIVLKTVHIFQDIPENKLAPLAEICLEEDFSEGETIIRENDLGKSLYIIISGKCSVLKGGTQITILGERDVFGELAALDPEPRSATITAIENMKTFMVHQNALYEIMSKNSTVAKAIINVLCSRIRSVGDSIS